MFSEEAGFEVISLLRINLYDITESLVAALFLPRHRHFPISGTVGRSSGPFKMLLVQESAGYSPFLLF